MADLLFSMQGTRCIVEANYNGYALPAMHPDRIMPEHDLIYMIEGEWVIGQDGERFTARAGDVLILSAGRHHYGIAPCSAGTNTMYLHINSLPGDAFGTRRLQDDCIALNSHIGTLHSPLVRRCFERIISAHSVHNTATADAYLSVLLYELAQLSQERNEDTLAEDIRMMLLSSTNSIPHNAQIAESFHVSQRTAENAFKKAYGLTIHQYMLHIKVEHACFYLKNHPDMTLAEIARDLGFYDEFHLSRQFKRSCGISPSEYRKQLQHDTGK